MNPHLECSMDPAERAAIEGELKQKLEKLLVDLTLLGEAARELELRINENVALWLEEEL